MFSGQASRFNRQVKQGFQATHGDSLPITHSNSDPGHALHLHPLPTGWVEQADPKVVLTPRVQQSHQLHGVWLEESQNDCNSTSAHSDAATLLDLDRDLADALLLTLSLLPPLLPSPPSKAFNAALDSFAAVAAPCLAGAEALLVLMRRWVVVRAKLPSGLFSLSPSSTFTSTSPDSLRTRILGLGLT
ncbi:MAG: hypothetical protein FRX49_02454 [Trebouxia sp. A1-2]|nr:MAG: hypothetical protein FRX49_02454 [Trebouxia sp. A1-2]